MKTHTLLGARMFSGSSHAVIRLQSRSGAPLRLVRRVPPDPEYPGAYTISR